MPRKKSLKVKSPIHYRYRKLADGSTRVYFDIYANGKRSYEFLGNEYLLVQERTAADKRKNAETMKAIDALKARRIIELANNKANIKKSNRDLLFSDYMENYRQQKLADGQSKSTATVVAQTIEHLKIFMGNDYNTMRLNDIDEQFVKDFINYLSTAKSRKYGNPIKRATAATYYTWFASAMKQAERLDIIDHKSPCTKISSKFKSRIKSDSTRREYLTADEIRQLENTPLHNPTIGRAFIFGCATGLRISDVRRLVWAQIQDGKIDLTMKKTNEQISVPLNATAIRVMGERGNAKATDHVFDLPDDPSTITKAVKAWAKHAGLTKNISFHTSRHSFATLILPHSDLYTVSKLLGHKSLSTTQIYADILDESKQKATKAIDDLGI